MIWTRRAVRRVGPTAIAALFALALVLAAPASAGTVDWQVSTRCRAPSGDGVLRVTNPGGDTVPVALVRASDQASVHAAAPPGSTDVTVPWGSADDQWAVLVDGVEMATAVIGNEWCVDTEVRVEQLRYACDHGVATPVAYDVVGNFEGVELIATPTHGGAASLPAAVSFALTPGSYVTSQAPSTFTVYDGGSFHFGAVVRYDTDPPDCAAPDAPQIEDEPDVWSQLEDLYGDVFGDAPGASSGGAEAGAPGDASAVSTTIDPAAPPPLPAEPSPAPASSAPNPAGAQAGAAGSTLPVTGVATSWLAFMGTALVLGGALLVRRTRASSL